METKKSKVFTRKVVALFLAVLMAATSLTGALSAYAVRTLGYHDDDLYANAVAWVEASSDQTCEALLDSVDDLLAGLDLNLSTIAGGMLGSGDHVDFSVAGLSLNGYVDSVDGVIDLLLQVKDLLGNSLVSGMLGDLKNLNMNAVGSMNSYTTTNTVSKCGKSYRNNIDAKQIILYVIQFLRDNINGSSTVLYKFLYGNLSIGSLVEGIIKGDIYSLLQGLLGAPDGYQSNLVYNLLKALLVNNIDAYPESEKADKIASSSFNFDTEAFETILPYYLNKLSFNITYPNWVNYSTEGYGMTETVDGVEVEKTGWANDCSKRRYLEIKKYMADNSVSLDAAKAHFASTKGWDANLAYNTEEGYEGNILVTQYAGKQLTISKSQSLYTIIWNVLPTIWKTAGEPTLGLVHVNYNGGESAEGSVGSNYDNAYYYWYIKQGYDWNLTDWTTNYNKVEEWAAAVCEDYGVADATTFLAKVKMTLKYDRQALNDKYNWRDIDSTKLFNEIRFSPLAVAYFNMQTGPLNLYFEQTGTSAINDFINSHINFDTMRFTGYTGIIDAINDVLVAALGDLFPNSANIGESTSKSEYTHISLGTAVSDTYTLENTGSGLTNGGMVAKLMSNAAKVFQYAADTTDMNILNPYYHNFCNDVKTAITEENIENAIIPFAISALKNWNLTASIHNSEWDKVKDIEGLAIVGLKEYLGYLFPDRDYEAKGLWGYDANGYIVASGTNILDEAIIPMAADAVGFVLTAAGVPFFTNYSFTKYKANQTPTNLWDPYSMSFTDSGMGTGINNKFFDYLNTTVVYFGDYYGIGALANLNGQISSSKTIWQNLDLIINAYLPVIGTLQGKGFAAADSKQLLWNDIVLGVVNIGSIDSNRTNASAYGFTNLLTIIADIFTSAPIKDENVEYTVVFEIVKPLINKLLGSRGSTTRNIINVASSSSSPVNEFLQRDNIITSVQNLVYNVYEAFSVSSQGADGAWKALSFIIQVTNLIPKLRDNTIGGVTATLGSTVQANVANGNQITPTTLALRNESWGLNRFYKDSSGKIIEAGRYYAKNVQSVKVTDSTGADVTSQFTIGVPKGSLDPEEREVLTVSGAPTTSNQLFTFTVTYGMERSDVYGGSVSKSYTNLKAKAYMYITSGNASDKSWSDAFSSGTVKGISDAYAAAAGTDNGLTTTTALAGSSLLTTPDLIMLGAGSAANGNGYGYRITNKDSASKTLQSEYAYPAAGVEYYDLGEGAVITSTGDSSYAYAALDEDGNVHCTDGTTVSAASLIADEIAWGYVAKEDGGYEAILVDAEEINSTYVPGTPIAGLFLNEESGEEIPKYVASDPENDIVGDDGYRHYALFDGQESPMTEGIYKMGFAARVSGTTHYGTITIAVGNIESDYSSYKSLADGYDNYYSSFTSIDANFSDAIALAKSRTVFDGVNIGNLEEASHMKEYREELETLAKTPRAVGTDYAAYIHNNVSVPRRGRSNVDYTVTSNYERAVDFAQAAEGLLIGTPVMVDKLDEDGKQVIDEETGEVVQVQDKDEDGYPLYTYTSNATSVQLQEAARLYTVYNAADKVVRRDYMGDLVEEEVVHATSVVDDNDVVVPATTTSLSDFTYSEDTSRDRYRFYLSTKSEDEPDLVDPYKVKFTGSTVRFGKLDNKGYLVNDGYPEDLWYCYVDALGESLAAIDDEATVSKTYDAKSHLIMAENALVLADQEQSQDDEGVVFSGTITIATDETGATGTVGVPGINILDANNNVVATSGEGGAFEFTVTEEMGTTFTVQGISTYDRTITISGSEEITGANIPVIVTNYQKDDKIDISDLAGFYGYYGSSTAIANLDGLGSVDISDLASFYGFFGKSADYGKLAFEA